MKKFSEDKIKEFRRIYNEAVAEAKKATEGKEENLRSLCGFSWISLFKTEFSKWANQEGLASKDVLEGNIILVEEFGQDIELKEEYAMAFARSLTKNGIICEARSRLD